MPKVVVCIPAYNRREMFRATLWSVLNQTYRDIEVIVSDNASGEDLQSEVTAANDPRVIYTRRKENVGATGNFSFLQTLVTAEYVIYLCSDDLLLPDCVEKVIAVLDKNPDRGGAVYMAAHYSEEGFLYLSSMPDRTYATATEYTGDPTVRDFRYTAPSLFCFRRAVFDRLGGWNKNLLAIGDWELYTRMVKQGGGIIYIHEALAIIRQHGNRDSNTTALNWGFYHDVMLLSAQPEYSRGNAYRMAIILEQLARDFRLKRSPWPTLKHAYDTGAFPGVLLYLPWEVLRRVGAKLRAFLRGPAPGKAALPAPTDRPAHFDRDRFDRFWRSSETVRLTS